MEKYLNYSDVYLRPRYSELHSRSEADISVDFLGRKFNAPWIPSNMSSVINEDIAKWLSENNYFYIMHRFGDTKSFIEKANKENWRTISISIGVKEEDVNLINWILSNYLRVDFITIDIAHGHSILVRDIIKFIKRKLFISKLKTPIPFATDLTPKIIAGNVATPEAVKDLTSWGADAIKVGIAGGFVCSTKNQTGFHIPMFGCVRECFNFGGYGSKYTPYALNYDDRVSRELNAKIPIISDGGIRENGDIAKSLVAGATMVMIGGLFAACIDAPGENIYMHHIPVYNEVNPVKFKRFHGSASAKEKGEHKYVEGIETEIPCNNMTYQVKYEEMTQSLRSAVSYAGGKDLSAFGKVEYITIK